jgi:hypothetical protein
LNAAYLFKKSSYFAGFIMGTKCCKTNSLLDQLNFFNNLQPHRDITIFVQFSSKVNISAFFIKYEAVYERLRFYKVTQVTNLDMQGPQSWLQCLHLVNIGGGPFGAHIFDTLFNTIDTICGT